MNDAALFALAHGSALQGLTRADHLLDVVASAADPEALLTAALAPDVFDCAGQVRTVTSFAYRCVMPVVGRAWALPQAGEGLAGLWALITVAQVDLAKITAADFAGAATRQVTHRAGEADLEQTSVAYVRDFAVPNLWFHLTMAYATLRAAGVDVGKADFDGLHVYGKGFQFD